MAPKYYYFIEDLDITDDNIPDGILVRQCKINIKNKKILYIKNNYISNELLKSMIDDIMEEHNKFKPILLPLKVINAIKNNNLDFEKLPRIIISKKSYFAKLLHKNNININKLLIKLNNIFL